MTTNQERLNVAHQAVLLEDARQLLRQQRQAAGEHQRQLPSAAATTHDSESDNMFIVGDVSIEQPPPQQLAKGGMSTLAKLLLGATLLAGGTGIGAALPLVGGLIQSLSSKPTVTQSTKDGTKYEFRIVPER